MVSQENIVSDVLRARDQLMATFRWNDCFAYVITDDRVRKVAEEIWHYFDFTPVSKDVDEIERAIRAGGFKIWDIPVVVQARI